MPEEDNQDNQNWKELALRAREKLGEATGFIQQLMSPPFVYGTVVNHNEDSVDVDVGGRVMEVHYNPELADKLVSGSPVRLNPESYAVVETRGLSGTGTLTTIEEVLEDGSAVINEGGRKQVLKTSTEVKEGDRILVDPGFHTVLQNLGKKSTQYHVAEVPVVPWSKIGGLETAIESLKDSIEEPFVHKEVYERYGKKAPKGVLLYGPPGCGKTLLAKAVAYNLTKRLKEAGKSNGNGYFLSIKGPELLDKYVGESERGIRELFGRARENSRARGDVTVVFMDEAEALLKKRGTGISSDVYDSIVPQFLSEMYGMNGNEGVVLILASNRADIIDPAVLRPGRIDRKVRIGRPNQDAVTNIFGIHLDGMPVYSDTSSQNTRDSLATYASEQFFSDQYPVFEARFREGDFAHVGMGHLASGAMVESISQRAAGKAIKREISGGKKGLTREDLSDSVRDEYQESRNLAVCEADDLREIFPQRYDSIISLNRTYKGGEDGN
jgi:proteasome-associated ATPase